MSSTIAKKLAKQTSTLINSFNRRADQMRGREDLKALLKQPQKERWLYAAERLQLKEGAAVGIDGSMDYDERMEMILFYVCATAYRCPFKVDRGSITIDVKRAERDSRLTASAAIPLWFEDTSSILPTTQVDADFELRQAIDRIPYSIMTLAELSIALNILNQEETKIIFLDRPISGTFSTASKDLRLLLRSGNSTLTTIETPEGKVSMLDLSVASVLGPGNIFVPARPPYLTYRAIQTLIRHTELTKSELAYRLNLNDEELNDLIKRLNKMNEHYNHQLLAKSDLTTIAIKPEVKSYWKRVSAVAEAVRRRVFESSEHPLQLDEDRWLTVLDINAVNLFLIYELLNQAQSKRLLLIGLTKDTIASDFTRSIIPYTIHKGLISSTNLPAIRNDRAFLTILTSVNNRMIRTPWRTMSYDVCFTTLTKSGDQRAPLKAARKVVSRERLFVKAYFQSKTFVTDEEAHSPVFVYDRFYNPEFDEPYCKQIEALAKEKVIKIEPYIEEGSINPLDDLILTILVNSDNPEVLEALGHNQLLYLADKAVKAEVNLMRGTLRGVADLHVGTIARKRRYFYIIKGYRGLRTEIEFARRAAAQKGGEA